MALSIVIITKNEAHIIGKVLSNIQAVTDDIVIVDSGSTDDTISICKSFNVNMIETSWEGYGENKNKGIVAAKYDWIISLDADECMDEQLKAAIKKLDLKDANEIFSVTRKNFFCNKYIRHGEWGRDKQTRIFNRNTAKWNNATVHEQLSFSGGVKITKLKGNILHYTISSLDAYVNKMYRYAKLSAQKYHLQQKKSSNFKIVASPIFNFIQHYFIQLGFLDGWEGYCIAKTNAWHTFLKYAYLKNLNKKQQNNL